MVVVLPAAVVLAAEFHVVEDSQLLRDSEVACREVVSPGRDSLVEAVLELVLGSAGREDSVVLAQERAEEWVDQAELAAHAPEQAEEWVDRAESALPVLGRALEWEARPDWAVAQGQTWELDETQRTIRRPIAGNSIAFWDSPRIRECMVLRPTREVPSATTSM